jgi:hypothetical protein
MPRPKATSLTTSPLSWLSRIIWPSDRVGANIPPPPLLALPVELIEQIYIYSQNPALPRASRLLYQALSNEYLRLQLCLYTFSQGFLRLKSNPPEQFIALEEQAAIQSTIIRQKWFTNALAELLEIKVPALQAAAQDRENKSGYSIAFGHPSFRVANYPCARMPKSLFVGPWTDEKVEMFYRLRSWYVEPDVSPAGGNLLSASLFQAIQENRTDLVRELNWYMRAGMLRGQDASSPRMPQRHVSISMGK